MRASVECRGTRNAEALAEVERMWNKAENVGSQSYVCGYCGNTVASGLGYRNVTAAPAKTIGKILLCSHCSEPTYFPKDAKQIPGVAPGNEVKALPPDVDSLYREARNCVAVSAHTGSVLLSRKLLMNIAVAQGAQVVFLRPSCRSQKPPPPPHLTRTAIAP